MKTLMVILQWIYNNLPMLLAIGAVSIGIAIRIRRFMRMSAEQKQAILKEQSDKIVQLVKEQLLALVTIAEKNWGSGTGKLKKSEVWQALLTQYGQLSGYITDGLIDKELVDSLIDDAVIEMEHLKETNPNMATAISQEEEKKEQEETS